MPNSTWTFSTIQDGPEDWRSAIHRGWMDAQNDAPWPRWYETASKSEQIGYESGRALVPNMILAGIVFPVWTGDVAGAVAVNEAWIGSSAKCGRPLPLSP